MYLPHTKELFPTVWVAITTSSCQILQTSSSFVYLCVSFCKHDDMLLKCNTEIITIHHFKNGRTCSCFIWGSNLSSKLFPFVLQFLQWWVSSQNFLVLISSVCVPVYLPNYLPSSLLLSSPGNSNMLLNSLLNGTEAFFFIFHQASVPLSLSHLHAQGIIVCLFFHSHLRNASILCNSTIKNCSRGHYRY